MHRFADHDPDKQAGSREAASPDHTSSHLSPSLKYKETVPAACSDASAAPVQSRVLLHPHHGLCFAFFEGKGYSDGFTENLARFLGSLQENDPDICLTCARDPVCLACPNDQDSVCTSREKVDRYDRAVLTLCDLREGDVMPYSAFDRAVREKIIDAGKRRDVCGDCQWDEICGP